MSSFLHAEYSEPPRTIHEIASIHLAPALIYKIMNAYNYPRDILSDSKGHLVSTARSGK